MSRLHFIQSADISLEYSPVSMVDRDSVYQSVQLSGSLSGTLREERLCVCNTGVQTVSHVFLHCPLLDDIREKYNVVDIAEGIMKENFLLEMECALGIRRRIQN